MNAYPQIELFTSDAVSPLQLGSDALQYVMRHGHTASIPTDALYFAEKVAIVTIAPRETDPAVLVSVNRAIDVIAASIRIREQIEAEQGGLALPAIDQLHTPNEGPMARLHDRPKSNPPSPAYARPEPVDMPF